MSRRIVASLLKNIKLPFHALISPISESSESLFFAFLFPSSGCSVCFVLFHIFRFFLSVLVVTVIAPITGRIVIMMFSFVFVFSSISSVDKLTPSLFYENRLSYAPCK